MGDIISIVPEEKQGDLTENALVEFIKTERKKIIGKLHADYPGLRKAQLEDVFQVVCIAMVDKAHDKNFVLTSSLYSYVYKCCWNQAEHVTRHPETEWSLPIDDILEDGADDLEEQPIRQDKVDQLLGILFESENEREELLNRVSEVVKDLPKPCDKILYGMYSTPRIKQEVIAKDCGYADASVVKTIASRCKKKFHEKFKEIYDAYKRGL